MRPDDDELLMVAPLEREVQAGVVKLYKQVGAKVWNTSQTRRVRITPGLPDLCVFLPGRGKHFFHETKTPTGAMSDEQRDFMACAYACDVRVVVGGEPEAREFLQEIGVL